jgi:hypothetical protein
LRHSDVLFGVGRAEAFSQLEQVISGSITPSVRFAAEPTDRAPRLYLGARGYTCLSRFLTAYVELKPDRIS